MNRQNLRSVTLKTLENYRLAAEHTVRAYRHSGQRLVRAMSTQLQRGVDAGVARLAPQWVERLQQMQGQVRSYALKGIEQVTHRTEGMIGSGTALAATQIRRAAERAAAIENRALASGLEAAARFTLPGAQAALAFSERLAGGATRLSSVAAGRTTVKAAVREVTEPVEKAAAKATKSVKKTVRKTVRAAKPAAEKAAEKAAAPKQNLESLLAATKTRAPKAKAAAPKRRAAKAVKAEKAEKAAE